MYHVSAQDVDERMINVHYYYYQLSPSTVLGQEQELKKRQRSQHIPLSHDCAQTVLMT